ncbi:acyl carrier protein [Streptomyces kanamyceticus]|uniref:Acyl carrier protein n=1 Tax=Streptomyces kanamyceticus TaxID=1967 RepID=A0A5J6GA00_STRKN|nr:acyl carrier protein [Streptomyces kanamyceticus]QEU90748.1 acyl carrier protein [Streptomyces kanamyceticus]
MTTGTPLTYETLAMLVEECAGVALRPADLAEPGAVFKDLGVDSLGTLGIVSELENRLGVQLGKEAEEAAAPGELLAVVNRRLTEEAGAPTGTPKGA